MLAALIALSMTAVAQALPLEHDKLESIVEKTCTYAENHGIESGEVVVRFKPSLDKNQWYAERTPKVVYYSKEMYSDAVVYKPLVGFAAVWGAMHECIHGHYLDHVPRGHRLNAEEGAVDLLAWHFTRRICKTSKFKCTEEMSVKSSGNWSSIKKVIIASQKITNSYWKERKARKWLIEFIGTPWNERPVIR